MMRPFIHIPTIFKVRIRFEILTSAYDRHIRITQAPNEGTKSRSIASFTNRFCVFTNLGIGVRVKVRVRVRVRVRARVRVRVRR